MVEDLCVLGCLLENSPNLEPHMECEFFMSWKGRDFQSPALVAWRGEQGQVGMEFHNTDHINQQRLREICAELLMKPLVRLSSRQRAAHLTTWVIMGGARKPSFSWSHL